MLQVTKVVVDPKTLTYTVEIEEDVPTTTAEDIEGTNRVYKLVPHIIDHVCVGFGAERFKDVMANTQIAHLLEHVVIELLARTGRTNTTSHGRTRLVEERVWETQIDCVDDTLTMAAVSSAVWMINWAFSHSEDAAPDLQGILEGMCKMVDSVDHKPYQSTIRI